MQPLKRWCVDSVSKCSRRLWRRLLAQMWTQYSWPHLDLMTWDGSYIFQGFPSPRGWMKWEQVLFPAAEFLPSSSDVGKMASPWLIKRECLWDGGGR